jgi:hypothetical protein
VKKFGLPFSLFVLLGLVAGITLFHFMHLGPGVSPDSVTYFQTAESLRKGQGFTAYGEPMTNFPPFYSAILALAGLLPFKILSISRLVQASIFGMNVIVFTYAVWIATCRNTYAALAAGVLFVSINNVVRVHSYAWSEGLFLFIGLSGYIILAYFLVMNNRQLLVAASVFVALAVLTRYAGLALVPPVIFILLLRRGTSFRNKLIDSSLFAAISCGPLAAWIVRNLLVAGSGTNRTAAFHIIEKEKLIQFAKTVFRFFIPSSSPSFEPFFMIIFMLLVFALIAFFFHSHSADVPHPVGYYLIQILAIFAPVYFVFLILSISMFDALTALDYRLVFPFNVFLLLILIAVFTNLISPRKRLFDAALLVSVLLLTGIQVPISSRYLQDLQEDGVGYQSKRWRSSQTISFLHTLPKTSKIYTNGRDVIAYRTELESKFIPPQYSPTSLIENDSFPAQLELLCQDLKQPETMLVYFINSSRKFLPSYQIIETHCDVQPAVVFNDGRIYMSD